MRLTENQKAILGRINAGIGFISELYADQLGCHVYYIKQPYSSEDGRSVRGLIDRGVLVPIGDSDYAPSDLALAALSKSRRDGE